MLAQSNFAGEFLNCDTVSERNPSELFEIGADTEMRRYGDKSLSVSVSSRASVSSSDSLFSRFVPPGNLQHPSA